MQAKPFNKPNFFILGAGKSGTTSLYHYIKAHPSVFMSEVKEPTFFCEDFQVIKNPIQYFELFENIRDEKIIGEASHGYLTEPKTARIMKTLFPESKFIIILRNPADRAYSLYIHMKRLGFEKIKSFEKALIEEENRFKSDYFKNNNPQSFRNFLYFRSGKYGAQIQRYLSLFDKKQFLFLTLDELKKGPQKTMNKVWEFLEVDPSVTIIPDIHNKGYQIRSRLIRNSTKWLDRIDRKGIMKNRIIPQSIRKIFVEKIVKKPKEPLGPEARASLMERYKEDQELLFKLTGIKFVNNP